MKYYTFNWIHWDRSHTYLSQLKHHSCTVAIQMVHCFLMTAFHISAIKIWCDPGIEIVSSWPHTQKKTT